MSYRTLQVDQRDMGLWITIDRPEALNSINAEVIDELTTALDQASQSPPAAIVLTGNGRAFCTGADLKWVKKSFEEGADGAAGADLLRLGEVLQRLERSPTPIIAAVNGICLAGGCELLCAVDLAIAAESAVIGDGHAKYGLFPGAGGSIRLPLLIGLRHAKRLLLTGETLTAAEAKNMGLVNWVVPDDQLKHRTEEVVASLASKAPGALGKMKYLANMSGRATPGVGLEFERAMFLDHVNGSEEVVEGLAAFAEKRRPNFRTAQ